MNDPTATRHPARQSLLALAATACLALSGIPSSRAEAPAAPAKVDFIKQVKPILEAHCIKCHGPERPTNGYRIYTKQFAFTAGDSEEQPIVAGHKGDSNLYQLISTKDKEHRMPQKEADPLPPDQIALIGRWIDEGANWPEKVELDTSKAKPGEKKPAK